MSKNRGQEGRGGGGGEIRTSMMRYGVPDDRTGKAGRPGVQAGWEGRTDEGGGGGGEVRAGSEGEQPRSVRDHSLTVDFI